MAEAERFEPDETISRLVDALVKACKRLERGDYLMHERVAEILGCAPHEGRWRVCVRKLKRRLEDERGVSLWVEKGVGYKLLSKIEQLTMLPHALLRRATRSVKRARYSVGSLPDFDCTDHLRDVKAKQMEALRLVQREQSLQSRRQAALCRPPEGRPRPNRPPGEDAA